MKKKSKPKGVHSCHVETERRFLLEILPDRSKIGRVSEIKQGYLECGLRLRKDGHKYFITLKGSGDIRRNEWEKRLKNSEVWVFDDLWAKIVGVPVRKMRYTKNYRSYKLEFDEFLDQKGFIILECEFKKDISIKEAGEFKVPKWVGRFVEVTKKKEYSNHSIALHGFPKDWKNAFDA